MLSTKRPPIGKKKKKEEESATGPNKISNGKYAN